MSTGAIITLSICGTIIVVFGIICYAALAVSKREQEREERWWRQEWEKIRKEEDTGEK